MVLNYGWTCKQNMICGKLKPNCTMCCNGCSALQSIMSLLDDPDLWRAAKCQIQTVEATTANECYSAIAAFSL